VVAEADLVLAAALVVTHVTAVAVVEVEEENLVAHATDLAIAHVATVLHSKEISLTMIALQMVDLNANHVLTARSVQDHQKMVDSNLALIVQLHQTVLHSEKIVRLLLVHQKMVDLNVNLVLNAQLHLDFHQIVHAENLHHVTVMHQEELLLTDHHQNAQAAVSLKEMATVHLLHVQTVLKAGLNHVLTVLLAALTLQRHALKALNHAVTVLLLIQNSNVKNVTSF
jgi:hypothetical protein